MPANKAVTFSKELSARILENYARDFGDLGQDSHKRFRLVDILFHQTGAVSCVFEPIPQDEE
jgi:hypothetical protein